MTAPRNRWKATPNFVWCDKHCTLHEAQHDVYSEGDPECAPANWRPVAVRTNDPNEEF